MNGWLNRLLKGSEFEDLHLTTKVARHTFATAGRRAGVDIDLLAEMMGHEVPGHEILNVYKAAFDTEEKDAALTVIASR